MRAMAGVRSHERWYSLGGSHPHTVGWGLRGLYTRSNPYVIAVLTVVSNRGSGRRPMQHMPCKI